jgi:hypothetical protein
VCMRILCRGTGVEESLGVRKQNIRRNSALGAQSVVARNTEVEELFGEFRVLQAQEEQCHEENRRGLRLWSLQEEP